MINNITFRPAILRDMNGIYENIYALGCARIGSKDRVIRYEQLKDFFEV